MVSVIEMSAGIGAMIVQIAAARGVPAEALTRATGFDLGMATHPDARIPLALEEALWNEAAARTGDDAFGAHAAELVQPGAFDVMDYAVRTAPSLRAALERLVRYNRLVHDAAAFTLVPRGDVLRIEHAFRFGGAEQCRHSAEFTIAATLVIAGQITGAPLRALRVDFRHRAPARSDTLEALARLFGVAPRFSMGVNALEIDPKDLDRPVPAADPALSRLIERHAEALLATRPDRAESTSDRVRKLLVNMLGKEGPSLSAIAERLRMSERSLQRRLADEGVGFDALLDEVRRDLAMRYLSEPKVAIAEVAYLLGYSEPSPFHRAFKRWTGMTPSEARARAA